MQEGFLPAGRGLPAHGPSPRWPGSPGEGSAAHTGDHDAGGGCGTLCSPLLHRQVAAFPVPVTASRPDFGEFLV